MYIFFAWSINTATMTTDHDFSHRTDHSPRHVTNHFEEKVVSVRLIYNIKILIQCWAYFSTFLVQFDFSWTDIGSEQSFLFKLSSARKNSSSSKFGMEPDETTYYWFGTEIISVTKVYAETTNQRPLRLLNCEKCQDDAGCRMLLAKFKYLQKMQHLTPVFLRPSLLNTIYYIFFHHLICTHIKASKTNSLQTCRLRSAKFQPSESSWVKANSSHC